MMTLPTALLRHTTPRGVHYDWLLGWPDDARGRLWTGRVDHPSRQWATLRVWKVEEITPHRRRYLTYEGALAPRYGVLRGSVRRIDQGHITPLLWTPNRWLFELHLTACQGFVELARQEGQTWRASLQI